MMITLGRLIDGVDKPEFLFRLRQLKRRYEASRGRLGRSDELRVRLPWGLDITVDPNEVIGYSIFAMGVYDLSVTEVLARLVSPGELSIDAGANIGQMCCVMALKSGKTGEVIAFEPYARVYERLRQNVKAWGDASSGIARIELRHEALSSRSGMGVLVIPTDIDRNAGLTSLEVHTETAQSKEPVPLTTIDDSVGDRHIGVLKLDVEGHELQVLRGGCCALWEHRIRDIVFEDYCPFPSDVHRLLQASGYSIFRISRTLFGPVLKEPQYTGLRFRDVLPNYLATLDPIRAETAMRPRKWTVLTHFGA